jgi:uncharacterized DUF497 family protein
MDAFHHSSGLAFEWDQAKAAENLEKHGVAFETACQGFLDPFVQIVAASVPGEAREAAIGMAEGFRLLYVVHVERHGDAIRIISARKATAHERRNHEDE